MIKGKIFYFIGLVAIVLFGIGSVSCTKMETIAFVYVDQVVSGYHRMQDVRNKIDFQQRNFDKQLLISYEKLKEELEAFEQEKNRLSPEKITAKEEQLKGEEQEIALKEQRFRHIMDSLNTALVYPVVSEINRFVEEYGKKNNLNYILGNLGSGNIMYANEDNNITEEILRELNEQYAQLLKNKK